MNEKTIQFGTCAIGRWQTGEARKDLRRLLALLREFKTVLAGAQGSVEEHALPEYEDRLREIHGSNLAALERVETLVTCASQGGVVLVPEGWLNGPKDA